MNWDTPYQLGKTGPSFNLRLAGGVYRFKPNNLDLFELLVNSSSKEIYGASPNPLSHVLAGRSSIYLAVNGQRAERQELENGIVSFSLGSGRHFQIQFQCPQILGQGDLHGMFQGKTWLAGHDSSEHTPVGGPKYYPLGDLKNRASHASHSTAPPNQPKVSDKVIVDAVTVRRRAAAQSLSVAFDLMTTRSISASVGEFFVNPSDLVAEGCHLTTAVVGATVTCFHAGPVGRLITGSGRAVSQMIGFGFKGLESVMVEELKNYILRFETKGAGQFVRMHAEIIVNGLDSKSLDKDGDRTPTDKIIDRVRQTVLREYEVQIKADIRRGVKERFPWARRFYETSFKTAASEACAGKASQDLQEHTVNGIIRDLMLSRIASRDEGSLATEIQRQQRQIEYKRDEMDEEVKKLPPAEGDAAKERKIQAVKDKYGEEIDKIEKDLRKAKETLEVKDRVKLQRILDLKEKEVDDEVKRQSERERVRQDLNRLTRGYK
ncbi:hypothetical protein ED733_000041 [Metarhizium rileyi]|uniref:Band 7 domain-containing protein n=1 Tax=Metarhizium rileyi (strain RCEF 4871) TaxID=1649241 RepID=A0A5C6G2X2_METRR|nr:hypothetical protein ED733_000041 [Metarhizium rileyi]